MVLIAKARIWAKNVATTGIGEKTNTATTNQIAIVETGINK
jgi:hypothetical protein